MGQSARQSNSNSELALRAAGNGKWELLQGGKVVRVTSHHGRNTFTPPVSSMNAVESAVVASLVTGSRANWPRETSPGEEPRKLAKHEVLPWVRQNLLVRFNALTRNFEIFGEPISGEMAEGIDLICIERSGVVAKGSDIFHAVQIVGRENEYNPFVEWLEEIQPGVELEEGEWNSLDERMLGHSEPGALTKLQRQLVGTVRRALNPGYQHDTCLILFGDQGSGKDTLLRTLFTEGFFYGGATYDPRKVDPVLAMYGSIAIGFAEVERIFSRSDSSSIKEFITRTDDRIRKPYGRATEHTLRHFTFWASSNDPHLLRDGTGNRRFPWVRHFKTDKAWIEENRERIFGTLLKHAKGDFRTWFNEEEIKVLNEEAQHLGPPDELRDDLYDGLRTGVYPETSVQHAWEVVCNRASEMDERARKRMARLLDQCNLLVKTGKRARKTCTGAVAGTNGNPAVIWSLKESVHVHLDNVKTQKNVDRGI